MTCVSVRHPLGKDACSSVGAGRGAHRTARQVRQAPTSAANEGASTLACSPLPLSLPAGLARSSPLQCPPGGGARRSFLMGKPPGPGLRRERDWHPRGHRTCAFGSGEGVSPASWIGKPEASPHLELSPLLTQEHIPALHFRSCPPMPPACPAAWGPQVVPPPPPPSPSPSCAGGGGAVASPDLCCREKPDHLCPPAAFRAPTRPRTSPVRSGGLAVELSKVPPGLKPAVWWRETPGGHPSAATYQPRELLHDPKSLCLSFLTCPMARTAPPWAVVGLG